MKLTSNIDLDLLAPVFDRWSLNMWRGTNIYIFFWAFWCIERWNQLRNGKVGEIEFWSLTKKKGGQFFSSQKSVIRNHVIKIKKISIFFFWNLKFKVLTEILIYFACLWDIGKWITFVKHILRLMCNHDLGLCHK